MDKEEIVANGVTDDFAWYELSRARERLNEVTAILRNLEDTLKARSREVSSYTGYLERKVRMLKQEQEQKKEAVNG
jgi:hypothetical protein